MSVGAVDVALGFGILASVALIVVVPHRRGQVGAFLSFGVIISLVWLRLGALDVAFAEAALGTGMLSAILVWLAVRQPVAPAHTRDPDGPGTPYWVKGVIGVTAGSVVTVVLGSLVMRSEQLLPQWDPGTGLPGGVSHEITGVLLAFRAYDTLLESAVLLFAGVIVLVLGDGRIPRGPAAELPGVAVWFIRMAAPVLLLLGLWLLFAGSSTSGGAFQSGAVLAAMLILLHVAGVNMTATHRLLRPALIIGVVVFIAAALIGSVLGGPWLSWPEPGAFALILTVEIALTIGITAGLYLLYLGLEEAR
ncbi:hydrogenase subunit MbhD domain-containing protein [Corynebacterium sp.]|uniref:hydrogenase subunit MbhD domain-containing protein n=1 Tax=Corynebacterium sp. TaxID=1720 RepID=UPI0026DED64B|nr:hydrogenase subunit MbhD domain-containing protein [Corynebacterium sp.]MDO5512302.1 DUF4040 domain-containing protein [Corynebacterium sp.]